MKKFKSKSKFLISAILTSSIIINNVSVASTLSYSDRYETFNSNNVSAKDVLEEQIVDMEIEGNSLANLSDINSELEIRNSNVIYYDFTLCETSKIKLNTDYTFIIEKELLENHNGSYNHFEIGVSNALGETNSHPSAIIDGNYAQHITFNKNKTKEVVRIKVNFKDFYNYKYLSVRPIRRYTDMVSTEYCNAKIKVVLLEGDYTQEDIRYFSDIESSGQSDNNIQIKYSNKNLYPYGDITSTWSNKSSQSLIGWIKVKPNTTYTASRKEGSSGLVHFIEYRSKDKVFNIHDDCYTKRDGQEIALSGIDTKTFTTGSKINYLYVTVSSGATEEHEVFHSEIMLEENNKKTNYVKHEENVIDINLSEPLRGIPGYKKDRIVKKDGRWYIERNCKEVIINLNNSGYSVFNWNNSFDTDELYAFGISNSSVLGTYDNQLFSSNKGLSNTWKNAIDITARTKGLSFALQANPPYIGFKLDTETIDSQEGSTLNEKLRSYLKSLGDIKIVLELLNPEYEPLNIELNENIALGTTHICSDSNVPVNIKFTIDRVANRAQYAIELAKTNPTIENVSQARYWSNLMKESILKDSFQNEANKIVEMDDLTVEKKSASVNSDIYIRMKNILSLSLDTNSVVFDDVDSTEDTELKNAFNLSVHSSLPYKINAYLEGNIYNGDKTSTLDKSILNIKASKDTIYQVFADTQAPVVIFDDQEAGVDTIHNVDLRLASNKVSKADIYKATIKFEVEQK